MDRLRFRSLASGSSGNCYYIGNASYGILIDTGVGIRSIRKFLKSMGLDFHNIWGVFITHDHTDHILAVGQIGEKYRVPIYAPRKVHEGINRNYRVTQKLSSSRCYIEAGDTVALGEFAVSAFTVSHDSAECVGYSVQYRGKTMTFATDLGYISDTVRERLLLSDYLVIEANYDEDMLANGPYPFVLQQRIKADTGHLCNKQTADFLADCFTQRWKYIFLCHLSKENNQPELALHTITDRLQTKGRTYEGTLQIIPLERLKPSLLYVFD